ncbi:MAG: hypothetical protein NT121_22585 [Chloroflexi bacterium]|nr:hypothetical protein [Chloroflexota bacterium]
MKILTHQKNIRRNARIGQYTSLASLVILAGGMYISFIYPTMLYISFIALLVGFEAGTLRRWSLRRWTDRGTVVAHNREAAEHRFFDRWFDGTSASYEPPAPLRPAHVPTSDHDVMGLFPEPQSRS